VSEFDNLKNEAEQYAQQHPQQIKEGEDAVEKKFGMGQGGPQDQYGQGQQEQGTYGQGQQDQYGQHNQSGQGQGGQQDQYGGDQQSGY
jgi:hypothetical protein